MMLRIVRNLPLVLLLVLLGASAPAQSASDLRRDLDEALEGDLKKREAALAAFVREPDLGQFRHLIAILRKRQAEVPRLRLQLVKVGEAIGKVREEMNTLRLRQRLTPEKQEELQEELKRLGVLRKETNASITLEQDTAIRVRVTLGRIALGLDDDDRETAGRLVVSRLRAAREPEDLVEILRLAVWMEVEAVREALRLLIPRGEAAQHVALLRAWRERGGVGAQEAGIALLSSESWPVRSAAAELLASVGGRAAVVALISRLPAEEGRVKDDVVAALQAITGENFHDNEHLWNEWLAAKGGHLPGPKSAEDIGTRLDPDPPSREDKRGGGGGGGFYGVDSNTKHPIFVIDFSGSMTAQLGGGRPPAGNAGGFDGSAADPRGTRRVDGVARELLRAIDALPSDGSFNVVLFASEVTVWKKGMQRASQETKKEIRDWVTGRGPGGATNVHGGLIEAFEIAGRGSHDKHYELAADTIYLLTDGTPTAGVIQSPPEICAAVQRLNDLRRIAIHTISVGTGSPFLRRLAAENSGDYVEVR